MSAAVIETQEMLHNVGVTLDRVRVMHEQAQRLGKEPVVQLRLAGAIHELESVNTMLRLELLKANGGRP